MLNQSPVEIELDVYEGRPSSTGGDKITPIRVEFAVVDFNQLSIELKSGTKARLNLAFNSLNNYEPNPKKPFEYHPVWLHRMDDHVWYEAQIPTRNNSTRHVRKDRGGFIDYLTGQSIPKDQVVLLEPIKKLYRCRRITGYANNHGEPHIHFIYETAKFYIHRKMDGTKTKYTKKTTHNNPIGFIDIDEERTLYLYPSKHP